jgi:PAS domain S-box-containing protein
VRLEKDAERNADELAGRRIHEREIERWSRLYATLSHINQTILRVKSLEELAREATRGACEFGGFKLAWIGQIQADTREVKPVGCAGEPQALIHDYRHGFAGDADPITPCSLAIRQAGTHVINDLPGDPRRREWSMAMEAAGIRAAAAFPIRVRGEIWGVFGVYSAEAGVFTEKEIALMEQAAQDVGYAIENLQNEAQRQQAEAALRQSEERRALALDAAQAGTWQWELATGRNIWSDELWPLYGLDPHAWEASYGAWRQSVLPEDREPVERALQEAVRREGEIRLEWRVANSGNGERVLMSRGRPLRDQAGRVTHYIGVVIEITERRRAEEALRKNEARLRLAVAAADIGLWDWDLQTDQVIFSTEWRRQIGYGDDEIPNRFEEWQQRVHPDDLEPMLQRIRAFLANPQSRHKVEFRFRHKDGSYRWIYTHGDVMCDAAGKPVRMLGCHIDITERKQTEEDLRRTRNTLMEAQRIAHLGSFEYVAATQTTVWSEEEYRIYGLDPAGPSPAYDVMLARCIHPDDAALLHDTFTKAMQGLTIYELEHRIVRPDGSVRWVHDRAQPYLDADGKLVRYVGTTLDITERRQLEQQKAAMDAQMRQQQKLESIGTLASGVAHEINNPITGILNYAQLIQDRLPGNSTLTEFTGGIIRETQRVATIVRNLLTFARNEKQHHSPARITDIIDAVLALVRSVLRHDQITLTVNVPADLPQLKCRSQQIQQVIMNLMTNARDALNERYPGHDPDKVITLEARLVEKAGRRWIRLVVEDHGTGISPEIREKVFDPFFTTKERGKGTGLGLSISHGIVMEHHGEWTVESEPGRFTRMLVDLPVDNGWKI